MNTWKGATFAAEPLELHGKFIESELGASREQVELYIKQMSSKLLLKMGLFQELSIHFDKMLPIHF